MLAYGPVCSQVSETAGRTLTSLLLNRNQQSVRPVRCQKLRSSGQGSSSAVQRPVGQPQVQHQQVVQHAVAQQQASFTERQTAPQQGAYREESDIHDEYIKVIGLGQRGISATTRLLGNKNMRGAEYWVLDTDAKVLSSCGTPNTIQIPPEEAQDAQLSAADLQRLAGKEAVRAAAEAPRQRPGSPVPTTGVAFLLAGAGGIPGGSTLLLQVAAYLRRTGFFVVTALTRPFEFEGRRKLEEADALIEALQDVAQLVVVVPQGVLTRASADLTINDASAIADNTLEVSCRAMLWALGAPEVLRASAGTMLWHGRDLRQYKRLLSPPLEVLLTCPGVGGLGRGLASIPVTSLVEAGLASGLSTLAEDAVAAAVESPFLEHAMPGASGVLCVLSLPARVLSHDFDMAPGALNDPEKYAIRAAVQVAAMTVVDIAGKHCQEVVVCAHVRPDWPHRDPSLLCLEATLLVLEDPAAAEQAASGLNSSQQGYPYMTPLPAHTTAAARNSSTAQLKTGSTILHTARLGQHNQQQQQQRRGSISKPAVAQGQRRQQHPQQPAQAASTPAASTRSAWSAMSAIAGGSAAAAVGQYRQPAPANQRQPASASPLGAVPPINGAASSSNGTRSPAVHGNPSSTRPLVNFFGNMPTQPNTVNDSSSRPGSDASSSAAGVGGAPQQQQQQPDGNDGVTYVPRMAEKHVDTIVAQSLDLPPSAARWRHQQRRQQPKQASSHFPLVPITWNNSSTPPTAAAGPGSAPGTGPPAAVVEGFVGGSLHLDDGDDAAPVDVRSRVAGMLQKERQGIDHSWLDQSDA